MPTLHHIEARAKALSEARAALGEIVGTLNDGIEALKRDHMKALKRCVNAAAEQHERLKAVIAESPELFTKPRTVVMHGIKLGFKKGTGSVEFDDAEDVVARIRKFYPEDQADTLVTCRCKPIKEALAQLSAAELKKLGVTVEDSGDIVFIKPTDSDVDKLVNALLKSAIDDKEQA